jgi:tRNA guanosine-2'-O-methyltransferase
MLIISSHLAALIELSPWTMIHHLPHVKTLLLSSSNHKGEGGDLDLSDATGVEAEEVTSCLVPDLAPKGSIMAAHLGTDVAPRAAIAFCLHNVAMSSKAKASVLPPRPQPGVNEAQGQSAKKKPKERPVIIFHEEGKDLDDWEKEEEATEEPAVVTMEAREVESDAEVAASGISLFKDLMKTALYDPVISNDNVKQGSEIHRRKVRLWQGIGVTSCFLTLTASPLEETREVAVAMIAKCFSPVSPPSVKQYAEGVLAGMLLNHPALIDELLLPAIESYELNHSGVGSLILIAGQVLMHIKDKILQETLIPRLILAMSPWLMSHSHSIRSLAQMITWAVLQRFPLSSDLWCHSQGDLTYLGSIIRFMDENPDLIRLRKGIGEESILPWSPLDLSHPARLYTNNVSLAGTGSRHAVSNTGKEWSSFEGCPQSVIDIIGAYLVLERHRLRDNIWEREREREEGYEVQGSSTLPGVSDFQRKISPQDIGISHDNMSSLIQSGLEELLIKARSSNTQQGDELEEDDAVDGSAAPLQQHLQRPVGEATGQEIIICATLVDKIPNLAGLARTCEIFKASCLCIPNSSAAQDPLFSSISVTAERWIPIIQVTEVQLMPFLIKKQKSEGFSVLGLEQSSESVMLPEFKFPKKCVLVLGREKEGLPAEIISMLDYTIEIPQLGLIRSLNVHVSGAIALYEYRRQHPPSKKR